MSKDAILQIAIAFFAAFIGYSNQGSSFILLMAPLAIYMVFKKDVSYLPALMIHCTSETSIMFVVLFSMMIVCITKAKVLFRNFYSRWLLIMLLTIFPIYIWLTWQRFYLDHDTWQMALTYSFYYPSFWAFPYFYLISNTITTKNIYYTLVSMLLFSFLCFATGDFFRKVIYVVIIVGIVYGVLLLFEKNKKIIGIVLGVSILLFFLSLPGLTFTLLLTFVYGLLIAYLSSKQHDTIVQRLTGILPYAIMLLIMVIGISSYTTVNYGAYSENVDFSDWGKLINRMYFKLFDDRAPFWDTGWQQLLYYRPVLPKHDIPNISVYLNNGHYLEEVTFGAHNSPIQLFRIFGFLMGGAMILCYILCTVSASKVFAVRTINKPALTLFSVSEAYTLVLFVTGTASMMPSVALFSFGLLGLASGLCKINVK